MKYNIFFLTIFLISSCDNSPRDYTLGWQKTLGRNQLMIDKYPSFKDTVTFHDEIAKKVWRRADTTTDLENKAVLQQQAINLANDGPIQPIIKLNNRVAKIKGYYKFFDGLPMEDFTPKTRLLIDQTSENLNPSAAILKGSYTNIDSALTVFDNEANKLITFESKMKGHHDEIVSKRKALKKEAEDKKAAEAKKIEDEKKAKKAREAKEKQMELEAKKQEQLDGGT